MVYESDGDTNCNWCTWNGSKMFKRKTRGIRNQRKNRNHLDFSSVNIDQNIEKWPRDMRIHKNILQVDPNNTGWGGHLRVRVNMLEYDIIVNEFKLQSRYYVYFRIKTLGKGMNSLFPHLVKLHFYCHNTRIALTLNNPQRLIFH